MPKTVQTIAQLCSTVPFVPPWSRCQVALEIECLSVMVEGTRPGNNAISVMGIRAAFFASQSAQLLPWII